MIHFIHDNFNYIPHTHRHTGTYDDLHHRHKWETAAVTWQKRKHIIIIIILLSWSNDDSQAY